MTELLHFHFSLSCIEEGNGNPLQCSCLEESQGRRETGELPSMGLQSWTQLKRLSSSSSNYLILILKMNFKNISPLGSVSTIEETCSESFTLQTF